MLFSFFKTIYDAFQHAFNPKVDTHVYMDETKQMLEMADKLRIKLNNNKVDEEFSDELIKKTAECEIKLLQIGECDPYRHQTSDTHYTDSLELDDIRIYIVYKKNGLCGFRTVTDITFTKKGTRYFPSQTALKLFLEQYDRIKDYDRSFIG